MARERNLTWHPSACRDADPRRPLTLWFTGLSGSGKSTLAFALERRLLDAGIACCVLDGDNIRHGLCSDLGFDAQSRAENIRRVAEVARLMNDAGLVVMAAFISPYQRDREIARRIIGAERFCEVHVSAPLAVCEGRDPKGLYRKARVGMLSGFTGVDDPYESPQEPNLALNTAEVALEECLERLLARVRGEGGAS
ncbi:adenylyl-sulfate kinase [Pseudomonas sp. 148P]|uniref:Adenylyl-sulfate kinase n=1 Tax=Pseudomonas ulcerans TaxID=3115852 RepID=A0ABU7HTV6_9PSED|nr:MULTISPECIES: adenylyl-sulfate kinase [unclassified Pseudomonas]MEE1923868.1 adenylyl-sulfate kinase [Pseudomonas sp. 147P]MEE1934946.1 adenylyl-sulfate kinase [Pseudomonas sp. 148P]